jgi:hypothetical protein
MVSRQREAKTVRSQYAASVQDGPRADFHARVYGDVRMQDTPCSYAHSVSNDAASADRTTAGYPDAFTDGDVRPNKAIRGQVRAGGHYGRGMNAGCGRFLRVQGMQRSYKGGAGLRHANERTRGFEIPTLGKADRNQKASGLGAPGTLNRFLVPRER